MWKLSKSKSETWKFTHEDCTLQTALSLHCQVTWPVTWLLSEHNRRLNGNTELHNTEEILEKPCKERIKTKQTDWHRACTAYKMHKFPVSYILVAPLPGSCIWCTSLSGSCIWCTSLSGSCTNITSCLAHVPGVHLCLAYLLVYTDLLPAMFLENAADRPLFFVSALKSFCWRPFCCLKTIQTAH